MTGCSQGQSVPFYRQNARYLHGEKTDRQTDRRMLLITWAADVRSAYKIFVQKSARELPCGILGHTLEDNIKMYLKEELRESIVGSFGTEYSTIASRVSVIAK